MSYMSISDLSFLYKYRATVYTRRLCISQAGQILVAAGFILQCCTVLYLVVSEFRMQSQELLYSMFELYRIL